MARKKKVVESSVVPDVAGAYLVGENHGVVTLLDRPVGSAAALVSVVENEGARELATVGVDDPWWKGGQAPAIEPGTIVRIRPPAGASRESIEKLVAAYAPNACAVKLLPPEPGDALPIETKAAEEQEPAASRTAREVVMEVLEEVPSVDKESLRDVVEMALGEAGL